MTLKELNEHVEAFLATHIQAKVSTEILYRGDQRELARIEAQGGFTPKKNGTEPQDIYNLIHHCTENGYGGPFISTSSDKGIAEEFKGNGHVYTIAPGCQIVDDCNWTDIQIYYDKIVDALKNPDVSESEYLYKNSLEQYRASFYTALQYNTKQEEVLVIGSIPIDKITIED